MSKLNRRQFIKAAGAASLSLAAPAGLGAEVLKRSAARQRQSKLGPVRLSIDSSVEHQSGVPLGGIGAGSVEIRPDGYFHDWLIFNLGSWAPDQPSQEQGPAPNMGPGALAFFLLTKQDMGEPQVRRLGIREDQNDLYSLGWAKNVQAIQFDGAFPTATLGYVDESLPVEITSEFFGPFIPHDARTSGTPGFHGLFSIVNRSDKPVEVSLMCRLKNPVAYGDTIRMLRNEIEASKVGAMLTMRTDSNGPRKSTLGSMSMSLGGGKPSWIVGEFESFLSNGRWFGGPHYGTVHESYLRGFRDIGELPSLSGNSCPAGELRLTNDEIAKLSASQKKDLIERLSEYPALAVILERVKKVKPDELQTEDGRTRVLQEFRTRLQQLAGQERSDADWGGGALCCAATLAPGETHAFRFELSWFFPHHFSGDGPEMGHMYENWFADSMDVNRFLFTHHESHARDLRLFASTLADTNMPKQLAAAWTEQLSTLTKCTWWTKADKFAVWEGLGCCGFHTMDITYQGSFSILALFPELQKSQMKMGAEFQRADGRVAHFFTPDLLHVDNGFDRVDMNPQFVMLCCRDYLWTGDRDYLERVFPHVVRAIANSAQLDGKGTGLPDHDTRRNTYDNWNFFGTPSYIASLWLGSLLAGERMARDLGKSDLAGQWKAMREKGMQSFERLLWNGEYYSLWVDGDRKDECCMSDQLSGVWFSHLSGMGEALPAERVKAALKAILKHNFSRESGLVNATYPEGRPPQFSTYMNGQATANWTGVEYAFASMLFDFGMPDEAMAIVDSIHDRYRRAGRVWNHVECGDHYYRAMSSWATLLGASGFKVDVPLAAVSLMPSWSPSGLMKSPWISSTGWGSFALDRASLLFSCSGGSLTMKELRLPLSCRVASASMDNVPVAATFEDGEGYRAVRFGSGMTLKEGGGLRLG